jgi:6-phosphogluconolactonase
MDPIALAERNTAAFCEPTWSVQTDPEVAALFAARYTEAVARRSVSERGVFFLAISGGATPKRYFQALAAMAGANDFPWQETVLFWVDERLVPPEDARSNYLLAKQAFLDQAPLLNSQIRRIRGELSLNAAVQAYEEELAAAFGPFSPDGPPCFDLVHLGLGSDGHAASLFPGDSALGDDARRVTGVRRPGLAPFVPRVTLTLPALNASRNVLFLASGADKIALARRIASLPPCAPAAPPAARIRPHGQLLWVLSP